MGADFYPTNMEGKAIWHANFAANINAFATKYNLTAAQVDSIGTDNDWIQFWVAIRFTAATWASQLSAYFSSISGSDPTLDPPQIPGDLDLAGSPPEVPPGIEFRVREIARHIKGHSSYAEADGALLGIIGESGGGQGVGTVIKPTIQTFAASSKYEFSVVVSLRGSSDSWQVWASLAGAQNWSIIATATGKSADVTWPPIGEDAAPAMLNVRVQLRRNNQDYGEVSDISQVTVNP